MLVHAKAPQSMPRKWSDGGAAEHLRQLAPDWQRWPLYAARRVIVLSFRPSSFCTYLTATEGPGAWLEAMETPGSAMEAPHASYPAVEVRSTCQKHLTGRSAAATAAAAAMSQRCTVISCLRGAPSSRPLALQPLPVVELASLSSGALLTHLLRACHRHRGLLLLEPSPEDAAALCHLRQRGAEYAWGDKEV